MFSYRLLELEVHRFQVYQHSYTMYLAGNRRVDIAKTRNLIVEGGSEVMFLQSIQGVFLLEQVAQARGHNDEPVWSLVAQCFPGQEAQASPYCFEVLWDYLQRQQGQIARSGCLKSWLVDSGLQILDHAMSDEIGF